MSATFFTDVKNTAQLSATQVPITVAASTNALLGTAIDMHPTDDIVTGILMLGACVGTSLDIDVKIQESSSSTFASDVVDLGSFTASYNETTGDNLVEVISMRRTRRYMRSSASIVGSAVTGVPIAVEILSRKKLVGTGAGNYTTIT